MCLAVAARIEGSVAHAAARPAENPGDDLQLAHPSGVIPVAATVTRHGSDSTTRGGDDKGGGWHAEQVVVYRTARRVMEGSVLVPASAVADAAMGGGAAARPTGGERKIL
jgi:2-methylaconitate cis-trans-isomerase PrpF